MLGKRFSWQGLEVEKKSKLWAEGGLCMLQEHKMGEYHLYPFFCFLSNYLCPCPQTKVFLGCEGVMANGGVLAEVGTSQVLVNLMVKYYVSVMIMSVCL